MIQNQVDTHSPLHKLLTEINDSVEMLKFDLRAEGTWDEAAENLDKADDDTLHAQRVYLVEQVTGLVAGIESIDAAIARRGDA